MPGPTPVHNVVSPGTTQFLVAAAMPTRRSIVIYNNTDQDLYLSYFPGITLSNFTLMIPPGYWGIMERNAVYTGVIYGLSPSAVTGNVQVTELVN